MQFELRYAVVLIRWSAPKEEHRAERHWEKRHETPSHSRFLQAGGITLGRSGITHKNRLCSIPSLLAAPSATTFLMASERSVILAAALFSASTMGLNIILVIMDSPSY